MTPKFIALCGNPTAGKTESQRILHERLGYVPVDDGRPLRQIAIDYLGLTEAQVTTQDGKKEFVTINSQLWQVRDILGEIGNVFEDKFGGDVIPLMALHYAGVMDSISSSGCSFGSVRRQQGHFYKKHGGMVIEIQRPGAGPSQFEFDRFDQKAVDRVVVNDGTLDQLERRLLGAVQEWSEQQLTQAADAD